ncbi:30S ribosomal protein S13p (S18e) [Candidatus Nasuia deltocephalinicola]|nr:30S ribosomal protein S13p (S18e) [Candidatus Nasuia deltocephalinicola]
MRILNIDLPINKQIFIGLTHIYGIGIKRSKNICKKCNINFFKKVSDLTNLEKKNIFNEISKIPLEGNLRNFINLNIKKLIDIKCYKGFRHIKGLPVRGQRTKTNAKTSKKLRKKINLKWKKQN